MSVVVPKFVPVRATGPGSPNSAIITNLDYLRGLPVIKSTLFSPADMCDGILILRDLLKYQEGGDPNLMLLTPSHFAALTGQLGSRTHPVELVHDGDGTRLPGLRLYGLTCVEDASLTDVSYMLSLNDWSCPPGSSQCYIPNIRHNGALCINSQALMSHAQAKLVKTCDCGASSVQSNLHSSWCSSN